VLATWNSKYNVYSSTDELIMSDAREHYHPGKWIAFQQNCCIQLATNFRQVSLHIYESQYFRQLVPKYPVLGNKYNPRTLQIFATFATTKTFRLPNFVRLSPNVNFSILSDYHLSLIRKYNRFPVIYLPGIELLSTPRHTASFITEFFVGKTTGTLTTSHSTW